MTYVKKSNIQKNIFKASTKFPKKDAHCLKLKKTFLLYDDDKASK